MSRSNYTDDCDSWNIIRWRGAVASAIKGVRGQKMLGEMLAALDAMPIKRLIKDSLELGEEVCALGCLGRAKSIEMSHLDPENPESISKAFGVAPALVQEIAFMNDEVCENESPEACWVRMRGWVVRQLKSSHLVGSET